MSCRKKLPCALLEVFYDARKASMAEPRVTTNPSDSSTVPRPIGVFDSGLGGLSVLKHLSSSLPHESFVFFADSAFCPYGEKSAQEIQHRCRRIVSFLLSHNAKAIVVACNTATAAAIRALRAEYDIPFIGMEPAVKKASAETKTGRIGVLATAGTFDGAHYRETSQKYAAQHVLITRVGEGLVELVEQNQVDTDLARHRVQSCIQPMIDAQVDQIVLGCTHYPFFADHIRAIAGPGVTIQDPSAAVARRTQAVLMERKLHATEGTQSELLFFTSGDRRMLSDVASRLFSRQIEVKGTQL